MHLNLKSRRAILFVALAVASVSAWMTINGMTALYKGAFNTMIAVMVTLEISKLTIAGWLIVGGHTRLKIPLTFFMIGIMGLSLLGHFGFLSEAYTQDSAVQTVTKDKAELMDKTISRYEQELADIQNLIDRTPDNFVTRRQQLYSNTADRRQELNRLIDSLYTARNSISKEEYVVDLQIGPLNTWPNF